MSLYDQFKTDADAEVSGVLLDYGSGGRIRIARAGGRNLAFTKACEAFQNKYERQINLKVLEDEIAEKELIKIYARTIILGWESGPEDDPKVGVIPGPDGKEMQFTFENACKLLRDLPDLFRDIREQSTKLALFREARLERDVGN
jgi:hypothetical protein